MSLQSGYVCIDLSFHKLTKDHTIFVHAERDAIKRTMRYSSRLKSFQDASPITDRFVIYSETFVLSRSIWLIRFIRLRARFSIAYNSVGMPTTIADRSWYNCCLTGRKKKYDPGYAAAIVLLCSLVNSNPASYYMSG